MIVENRDDCLHRAVGKEAPIFASTILSRAPLSSGKRVVSGTALRISVLATVAGYSISAVVPAVAPGSGFLQSSVGSNIGTGGQSPCCTNAASIQFTAGSLDTRRTYAESDCHCTLGQGTITTTSKGTASWKSAYAGSASAVLSGTISSTTYSQGVSYSQVELYYPFTTDSPYEMTVDCSVGGSGSAIDNSVTVRVDSMDVCGSNALSATGSIHLTPGSHNLISQHVLDLVLPAGQTGAANQRSSIKWRLDGCESRKANPISNDRISGIVDGYTCDVDEPLNIKQDWFDEQAALFRLTCEGAPDLDSSFNFRYHPDGTDPYVSAAQCVWGGGQNYGNIYTPGDTDNDGQYDCFVRSEWINAEPTLAQGVPNMRDFCFFTFDVKTKKLKSEHDVLDPSTNRFRPATAFELGGVDNCALPPGGSALVPQSVNEMTGGIDICDQNGDGVCNAVDVAILTSAIGASTGDALYSFRLDLDDDGWVLDDDMRALFPSLDFDGDGILNGTDNCLMVANPPQMDIDGDGRGGLCDCATQDPTLFASPLEIIGLSLPDAGSLSWDSDAAHSGSSTEYDVLSGALAELPVGGGASERCISASSLITIANDILDPAPGTGFYYLIRGRNACGEGTYGQASNGTPRTSSTCPGN